jgi:ATP-dependent 26S proteasome regulatory subunit
MSLVQALHRVTLFQVHPEGKYVVDVDKGIDIANVNAGCRVALRADSYALHKILPNKVSRCSLLKRLLPHVLHGAIKIMKC